MSHIPERKEKDCLNCGTLVQGPYCHNCGQENVVPKETFWHMFTHFFYDITHFDSSFFHTIHHLILKPGFLSKEYMVGRRVSYLHPVRMYVFTSAIFFLLFFTFFRPKESVTLTTDKPLDAKQRGEYIISLQNRLKKDTANRLILDRIALISDTSRPFTAKDIFKTGANGDLDTTISANEYKSIEAYDSIQRALPPGKRHSWLKQRYLKIGININSKYQENPNDFLLKLSEGFFHRLPYMLFVSLPLFAFILKLVYIRRKQFFFADHGVFTIHLYVFTFIVLLAFFCIGKIQEFTHGGFFTALKALLFIGLVGYLYISMRNFYKQGWGKTFIKFLLVIFSSLVMMLILFAIFLIFSAATL
ncbi:MAG: DUF3667 domain-containing protein [Chitinophagaceae bacterium]